MRPARPGVAVRVDGRRPPWIVVAHEPASLVLAGWPGRLWRVRITDAVTAEEQRLVGNVLKPSACYTRATAVEIVREEETWRLFGPEGQAVLNVVNTGLHLDRARAGLLAAHRHPGAPLACDRLWRAWMQRQGIPDNGREDFDGVLMLGLHGSPVNQGLNVLHDAVLRRARALDGDAATMTDRKDVWLAPPWAGAHDALNHAALTLGCPGLVNPVDTAVLMHALAASRP